jgi:hypothetical protein
MIDLEKFNLSLLMLLPLAIDSNVTYKEVFGHDLEAISNGYAYDKNRPWLNSHAIVTIEQDKKNRYEVAKLKAMPTFQSKFSISVSGIHYDEYVLEIQDKFKKDRELILQSCPSNISSEAKLKIVTFWLIDDKSKVFRSLFASEEDIASISEEVLGEEDVIERHFLLPRS